jgi:hypothetical protein
MAVDGISGGAVDVIASQVSASPTPAAAQVNLLKQSLDASGQMMDQLLKGLQQPNPAGVGGSVNRYA